jgi:hypothetical protein
VSYLALQSATKDGSDNGGLTARPRVVLENRVERPVLGRARVVGPVGRSSYRQRVAAGAVRVGITRA